MSFFGPNLHLPYPRRHAIIAETTGGVCNNMKKLDLSTVAPAPPEHADVLSRRSGCSQPRSEERELQKPCALSERPEVASLRRVSILSERAALTARDEESTGACSGDGRER